MLLRCTISDLPISDFRRSCNRMDRMGRSEMGAQGKEGEEEFAEKGLKLIIIYSNKPAFNTAIISEKRLIVF